MNEHNLPKDFKLNLNESLRMRKMKDSFEEMDKQAVCDLCEHLLLHLCYRDSIIKNLYAEKLGIGDAMMDI